MGCWPNSPYMDSPPKTIPNESASWHHDAAQKRGESIPSVERDAHKSGARPSL